MQATFNDIPCIYFLSDGSTILMANEALGRYLGYTPEELHGRKLESIFTLATRIFQQTHLYPLLQMQGHAEEIYITLRTKAGDDVPVLVNAERKETGGQPLYHFAGIAVTKRKKFEEEIIAAKKAAEKALHENTALKAAKEELQKHAEELDHQIDVAILQNKALLQFSHIATHSLQEPVRKVLVFTSQLLETDDAHKMESAGRKIKTAADELREKLAGLQQYVWLTNEAHAPQTVDLQQVLENARTTVAAANKDVAINLEASPLPPIEANREQIQFLLTELLTNAVRFRKDKHGVAIKIFGSVLQLNQFRQLPGKYKYLPFLKLQVQDDGIGFDGRYQEQAFELFRKLHPNSGRGIGLALCRRIVEQHGGTLTLESEPEKGTSVILYLPLPQEQDDVPT